MPNTCSKCIQSDNIKGVQIDDEGVCNRCKQHKVFTPYGENALLRILAKARKKKRIYDALVPLSGGKDSTYVLYLAVKKYKLRVLSYTFDNGFMSELAKENIKTAISECGVDHIFVEHDPKFLHELYRTTLMHSGEICGVCGIGIERSMLKISEAWRIPIILLGHSPTENNSFTSENIYDQSRLKAILDENKSITPEMRSRFLVYPRLNFISSYLYTILGRFGKKVNMLYYLNLPSDKEIGNIIKQDLKWKEPQESEYTRHFDCIAEAFSNYIREKRFGSSRRLPQLCNMIRNKEVSRDEALKIYENDLKMNHDKSFDIVMSALKLNKEDIEDIVKISPNVFCDRKSFANLIFAKARILLKKNVS